MEQPPAAAVAPLESDDGSLRWTAHPAVSQPRRTAAAIFFIGITWIAALEAFGAPLFAAACCLALIGSIAEWLFPTHHQISAGGVSTRCAWQFRTIPWDSVRSITYGPHGLHLSPFRSDSRMSRVRGVTLRFADENERDVRAAIRRYYPVSGDAKNTERAVEQ